MLEQPQINREGMDRSASPTAVPGWGLCIAGVTALIAAPVAFRQASPERWLAVWIVEAVVAATITLVAMQRKATRLRVSPPVRRLYIGLLPALAAGALLTIALLWSGPLRLIPGVWLVLYGVAVIQAGAFSFRALTAMGAAFVLFGAAALSLPWLWANVFLAAGFGLLHIAFGIYIALKHGG